MEQEQININEMGKKMESLLQEVSLLKKRFDEELGFIEGTEEAWQEIDKGKCTKMELNQFLEEAQKW